MAFPTAALVLLARRVTHQGRAAAGGRVGWLVGLFNQFSQGGKVVGGGGGGAGSSAGSRAGVIWPRHHLRAAPHATAPPHSLSPKRRWTDQGLRLSHTQEKEKLLVIADRLKSTRIGRTNF